FGEKLSGVLENHVAACGAQALEALDDHAPANVIDRSDLGEVEHHPVGKFFFLKDCTPRVLCSRKVNDSLEFDSSGAALGPVLAGDDVAHCRVTTLAQTHKVQPHVLGEAVEGLHAAHRVA